jgi:hypothetical protein
MPGSATSAPYRVVSLATPSRKWTEVDGIAPNGLVVVHAFDWVSAAEYYVVDAHTGARRYVDATTLAVNAAGDLARTSAGSCGPGVSLVFRDGTVRSVPPPPLAPAPASWECFRQATVAGVDDDLRIAATLSDYYGAHAYLWDGTEWKLQPPLESDAVVVALGAGMHAVGWSAFGSEDHAVLWRNGVATDLGPGRAYALNSADVVVGQQAGRATSWTGTTATPLPLPAGWQTSRANGVSDAGVVVGGLGTYSPSAVAHGFLHATGVTYDVNDLLDRHDLLVVEVTFVARDGTLAGQAVDANGNTQAFAAVPTGAPLAPDTSWRDAGQVLARGEAAGDLAVGSGQVVWTASTPGGGWAVRRVAAAGGLVTTVAEGPPPQFTEGPIALGGGYVYLRTVDLTASASEVRRVRLADGAVETVEATSTRAPVAEIAADERFVYLRTRDGAVVRLAHAGGDPVVLDAAPATAIATDGEEVWYAVAGPTGPTLRSVPRGGGPPRDVVSLALMDEVISAIRLGPHHVYFTMATTRRSGPYRSATFRVPREGGAPERMPYDALTDLDANGEDVFWARPFAGGQLGPLREGGGQGCLARTAPDGSGAWCVDAGPFRYRAARADSEAVYFLRDLDVVRLPR